MNPIRTSIIGQGRSGRDIRGLDLPLPGDLHRTAAIEEKWPGRRVRANSDSGCPLPVSHRVLFGCDDIDPLVNASCCCRYVPPVLELPENGPNLLCQKPPARTCTAAPPVGSGISSCSAFPAPTCRMKAPRSDLEGSLSELKWHWFDDREAPHQTQQRASLSGEAGAPRRCHEEQL